MNESLEVTAAKNKLTLAEHDRRISELEHTAKVITELTFVTKDLVESVKDLATVQKVHTDKLIELEQAPGKKLIKIENAVVVGLFSAFGGWLFAMMFQA